MGHPRREDILAGHAELAARWAAALTAAGDHTDTLGRPMDPGIVPTVAALHLLGLPTAGSCHGHWHRASAGPWVHIGPAENDTAAAALRARVDELIDAFNAGRRRVQQHRRLHTFDVHVQARTSDRPPLTRVETLSLHEVMRGRRPRTLPDLRAARREMARFTDYLLQQLANDSS